MRLYLTLLLLPLLCTCASAQNPPADTTRHRLTFTGLLDAYYAYYDTDSNEPFAPYISAGPRDNQFGINVALVGFNYEYRRVRASFAYQAGDIPASSWSTEFPNIREANVGVNIAEGWWLDAGFFTTHIGYESIVPNQKYLSSTAFLSFNEPFFQSGLRLACAPNNRWAFTGWLLNGYNSFVDNNDAKSAGVTIAYTPTETTTIVYNNLLGDERPEGAGTDQFRIFQNVYWEQQWSGRFLTVLNADYASQTNSDLDNPTETAAFYGAFLTARYEFTDRWSLTGRAETQSDEFGFISGTLPTTTPGRERGLQVSALALSAEYRPAERAYLRAAGRLAREVDVLNVFVKDGQDVNNRLELLLTFGITFDRDIWF